MSKSTIRKWEMTNNSRSKKDISYRSKCISIAASKKKKKLLTLNATFSWFSCDVMYETQVLPLFLSQDCAIQGDGNFIVQCTTGTSPTAKDLRIRTSHSRSFWVTHDPYTRLVFPPKKALRFSLLNTPPPPKITPKKTQEFHNCLIISRFPVTIKGGRRKTDERPVSD